MAAPDILMIDGPDSVGMTALVAAIAAFLTQEERKQFAQDLDAWEARYRQAMDEIAASPEWQEIEQWRSYILSGGNASRVA